jgi:pimeloyl-ACP methyl ester carboxylesterase
MHIAPVPAKGHTIDVILSGARSTQSNGPARTKFVRSLATARPFFRKRHETSPHPVAPFAVKTGAANLHRRIFKADSSSKAQRLVLSLALIVLPANSSQAQSSTDTSPHTAQFVTVENNVKLEVLDWGGKGRPLIFLSGLGNTAHVFDQLAPKFTASYHVYGITRRGFGNSSKPDPVAVNYTADRLGDDVLAVIAALKLNRPVLIGHSIAGEELSSIATHHPEKVAGLIYLDAADAYAFYDPARGDWMLDLLDLKKQTSALETGAVLDQNLVQQMLTSTSRLQKDLQDLSQRLALMPSPAPPPPPPIGLAIRFGEQKYTRIPVPALAIFACPHNFDPMFRNASAAKTAMIANDRASCTAQADAFQAGVPSAYIVCLPNADHYVFYSNEADVIREMNAFLVQLPAS